MALNNEHKNPGIFEKRSSRRCPLVRVESLWKPTQFLNQLIKVNGCAYKVEFWKCASVIAEPGSNLT